MDDVVDTDERRRQNQGGCGQDIRVQCFRKRLVNTMGNKEQGENTPSYWLLKTEPSTYSFADLERDGRAVWDGVSNALALKHLRSMKRGDLVFIYHTGDEKQIVGIAMVTRDAYPDPKGKDPRLVVVDLEPQQRLPRPVTLVEVKAGAEFGNFELVRMGRLSVMPVSPARWRKLLQMGTRL
jgi:predicted RNA-binding protein with PUA-like domain